MTEPDQSDVADRRRKQTRRQIDIMVLQMDGHGKDAKLIALKVRQKWPTLELTEWASLRMVYRIMEKYG